MSKNKKKNKNKRGGNSNNDQANFGTGRDGNFGTGTHGSGMPSNPGSQATTGVGVSANDTSRHTTGYSGGGSNRPTPSPPAKPKYISSTDRLVSQDNARYGNSFPEGSFNASGNVGTTEQRRRIQENNKVRQQEIARNLAAAQAASRERDARIAAEQAASRERERQAEIKRKAEEEAKRKAEEKRLRIFDVKRLDPELTKIAYDAETPSFTGMQAPDKLPTNIFAPLKKPEPELKSDPKGNDQVSFVNSLLGISPAFASATPDSETTSLNIGSNTETTDTDKTDAQNTSRALDPTEPGLTIQERARRREAIFQDTGVQTYGGTRDVFGYSKSELDRLRDFSNKSGLSFGSVIGQRNTSYPGQLGVSEEEVALNNAYQYNEDGLVMNSIGQLVTPEQRDIDDADAGPSIGRSMATGINNIVDRIPFIGKRLPNLKDDYTRAEQNLLSNTTRFRTGALTKTGAVNRGGSSGNPVTNAELAITPQEVATTAPAYQPAISQPATMINPQQYQQYTPEFLDTGEGFTGQNIQDPSYNLAKLGITDLDQSALFRRFKRKPQGFRSFSRRNFNKQQ